MAELDPKALYHRTLEKMFTWLPSDPKLRQEDIDDGIEFFEVARTPAGEHRT